MLLFYLHLKILSIPSCDNSYSTTLSSRSDPGCQALSILRIPLSNFMPSHVEQANLYVTMQHDIMRSFRFRNTRLKHYAERICLAIDGGQKPISYAPA